MEHNSYNMVTKDMTEIYARLPRAYNICMFDLDDRYCNQVSVRYSGFNVTWNETLVGVTVEASCTGPGLNGKLSSR